VRLHFCDATGSADSHHQDGYPYIEGIWRPKCEGGLGNRDGGSRSTMFEERRGCYADWELLERQREVCQAALGEEEEYALSLAKTQVLVPPTGIHPCDTL